jgi:hypothetical protein
MKINKLFSMKINKPQIKIRLLVAIALAILAFGGQAAALSIHSARTPNNFALIDGAGGGPSTGSGTATTSGDQCQLSPSNCIVTQYVNPLIKFLSAAVGIAVVISIVIGGIQYSSARDDPQAVGAAKKRITNAIFALIVYMFLFALLNFIIPGGLL